MDGASRIQQYWGYVGAWRHLARPSSYSQLWLWRAVRWEERVEGLFRGKEEEGRVLPGAGSTPGGWAGAAGLALCGAL